MKQSLTAPGAPSLSTSRTRTEASLEAHLSSVWETNDKDFDIQDAQNAGHLDLSANYKFAEGWTADPRVGFTAPRGGGMEGTGFAMPLKTNLVQSSNRQRDRRPKVFACAHESEARPLID